MGRVNLDVEVGFEGVIVVSGQPVGTGTVRYLSDDADPQRTLDSLTAVEAAVLAARLRTWADNLDGGSRRAAEARALHDRGVVT